jgi:hypothetical protein
VLILDLVVPTFMVLIAIIEPSLQQLNRRDVRDFGKESIRTCSVK